VALSLGPDRAIDATGLEGIPASPNESQATTRGARTRADCRIPGFETGIPRAPAAHSWTTGRAMRQSHDGMERDGAKGGSEGCRWRDC
jgi:hypothetical protein